MFQFNKRKDLLKRQAEEKPKQVSETLPEQEKKKKKARKSLSPESKRVLLIWLFYNIKNPYPTNEEKLTLSQKAKVPLVQVNNFFVNARRRLLKPILDVQEKHNKSKSQKNKLVLGSKVDIKEINFEQSPNADQL
ncbi:hypothetical protein M0811_10381 [Anaeramoeba ignava]|uniref:Homeobox domain-containing protein n=1 Tax=Anaeramoeba ignava TaxID=1746090 RepID=A0A9Q0R8S0_ANAIG|nr:hypothetical protein M0811_10381 [Anaeramoeba ignava]